jgi:hypothetical protein
MKKLGFLMLTLLILVLFIGCGNSAEGDTPDTTAKATVAESEEDMVIIKGINATDVAWVFDREPYGSNEYRGEIDAIHAKDFSIEPGETFLSFNTPISDMKNYESYVETSKDTYEIRLQLIAGGPTPTDEDEQYVYDPYVAVVDFIITGTYGKPVTVEWDGKEFKQLD